MRRCLRAPIVSGLVDEQEMKTQIQIQAMKTAGMKVRRVGPVTAMVTTPGGFVQRVRFDGRAS